MSLNTLACIKRVPDTGAKINLTDDEQDIDAAGLGYTMSPHEECAIEEAVSQVETHGGTSTVLTLGPADAAEQLQTGLAMQADEAVLLPTNGEEWDPMATAEAIASAITEHETEFDLLFFGNESADSEHYQVGIRVARELGMPCVTGIKELNVEDSSATAHRDIPTGSEIFEIDLPAVITVKEGINEPRYPSMRSKMQARRKEITEYDPSGTGLGPEKVRLITPEEEEAAAEVLGTGPDAAGRVVDILEELEVV